MKKLSLKALCASISTLMAMMAITTPIAQATDTEIYQAAKEGDVTLMLMLDISGSMGIESYQTDYALRYSRPEHICHSSKIKQENMHNNAYVRSYCEVPVTEVDKSSNFILKKEHPYYPETAGAWLKDPVQGCSSIDKDKDGKIEVYHCYDRISRLKDALYDALMGNPTKGIVPIGDDKIIGLSTLGVYLGDLPPQPQYDPYPVPQDPYTSYSAPYWRDQGSVRVPARRLDWTDPQGNTQRQILIKEMSKMGGFTTTPTARSYAEVSAYMLGTTTVPAGAIRRELYEYRPNEIKKIGNKEYTGLIRYCQKWDASGRCIEVRTGREDLLSDVDVSFGQPTRALNVGTSNDTRYFATYVMPNLTGDVLGRLQLGEQGVIPYHRYNIGSSFEFSAKEAKKPDGLSYQQPESLINQKNPQCSGQGIYVLSDGAPSARVGEELLMKTALGNHGGNFSCSGSGDKTADEDATNEWNCMYNMSQAMLDKDKNPGKLSYKTAMVGFGRNYLSVAAYDPTKTLEENSANILGEPYKTDKSFLENAGKLSVEKKAALWGVRGGGGWYPGNNSQDVVNSINSFIAALTTTIPEVVTGQPFIPVNPLNPLRYMDDAYYGTFSPKIGVDYRFWAGDMNKYLVKNQKILDKDGNPLFNDTGFINAGTIGYWDAGMASKLPLRQNQRQVFTNTVGDANTPLTKVTVNNLYGGNAVLSNSVYRNAWLNALGYRVNVNGTPVEQGALPTIPELRQVGAVLHSTPIILTQTGKVVRDGSSLNTSKDREDYLLYGSTQGMIHVVNTQTGVEKVAFVPQEMITRPDNRQNFQDAETALGAMNYGMDGQWTAYTQYKALESGGFTVNDPNNTAATSTNLGGFGLQWVYGGMRMGGRSYYALDLSNMDAPKLKFHIAPESAADNTPLYYMGQSWSKPTLGFVRWQGQRRLVMFVGGGYDAGYENRLYDQATANTTGQASGAGVYMFDAHTGELLWWSSKYAPKTPASDATHSINNPDLQYSVVSNISTFDRDNDGLVDNLIFGDLGGQVFRVDLDNGYDHTDNSKSLATRVVRVYNGHQPGGLSPRFYDTPSLSVHSQEGVTGQFGVISIASGNRSSPLAVNTESARDGLFVIFDRDVLKRGMAKGSFTPSVTDANKDKLTEVTRATNTEVKATDGVQGWKFYFTAANGRLKGYSSPRVVDNFLFVGTYTPEGGTVEQSSCSAGIIGESFQEVFCMPGGVCNKETTKRLGESVVGNTNPEDGSKFRFKLGVGIVQAGIGNAKDSSNTNTYGTVSPTVDCTKSAYKNSPACLQEISSISNKPVRWYEDTPRTKAN